MADRDPRAALTKRLSELLGTPRGAEALAAMQRLALVTNEPGPTGDVAGRDELRFGIWEPVAVGEGEMDFVRNPALASQWRFWADIDRIRPKRSPRVVLLGESVARGYLYDPSVTPAGVLERMLQRVPGLERAEVVDLARTDLGIDGLRAMLDLVPALEPDAVVLFAGNNWHNLPLRVEHLQLLADALRADGYGGIRRVVIHDTVLPRIRRMLDELAASLAPFDIPVAIVVPEFNLADWRSEPAVLVPTLRGSDHTTWMAAREEAEAARDEGRADDLERIARGMVSLDRGTSALSQNLLADALLALGREAEARVALEAARDAVYGLMIAHSPRCPSPVQDTLRARARELGFAVVDLPAAFVARHVLPDRRFLLDYCHLTIEGMRVAVAATAEAVAGLLGLAPPPTPELEATDIPIPPLEEALAHVLAAIHNAHWGQDRDVVGYHCRQAVRRAPEVVAFLLAHAEAQSHHADRWLGVAFDHLMSAPNVRRYLGVDGSWMVEKLADFDLLEAIVDAVEQAGTPARARIDEILRAEHGQAERVNLLDPRYCARTFGERNGYGLGQARGYFRALDRVSQFVLVRDEVESTVLRLTCRVPAGDGEVGLRINGSAVAVMTGTRHWRTHVIELRSDLLHPGTNRVEIVWPLLAPSEELIEEDARRIERGEYPDVLPAFGDVHAFLALRGTMKI